EHARLADARIIECAGLAGRNALLTVRKFHLNAGRAAHEPTRMRRARRADFYEDIEATVRRPRVKGTIADPVHVPQLHARRAQRLPGADDDPAICRIEPHDIERLTGRDAKASALADREIDDAGVTAQDPPGKIDNVARGGGARP